MTLALFAKNAFFDILEIFNLGMCQISSNQSTKEGLCHMKACLSFH